MSSPSEHYRAAHPDLFSDSQSIETSELDRSLLEFHISEITTKMQETAFENFVRRLCERTICPNLKPQTGPMGGGDAKADAETYPVSSKLRTLWYEPIDDQGGKERWAFAISAQKTWKSKCNSDIKKIAETNRNFQKAYFITNQPVKSKDRAQKEEELTKKFGLEVHILDRTWLLTKVFEGHLQNLAIEELAITGLSIGSKLIGPNDAERQQRFNENEVTLLESAAKGEVDYTSVEIAIEQGDLARQLEKTRVEIDGLYARALRLAKQIASAHLEFQVRYDLSWTAFWWFDDHETVKDQYEDMAKLVLGSKNVHDWEKLGNLWALLMQGIYREGKNSVSQSWFEDRTTVLMTGLSELAKDKNRPSTALSAREHIATIRVLLSFIHKDDPSPLFDELTEISEQAKGLVGFSFETLTKVVEQWSEHIIDNESFDLLFDKLVEIASTRSKEITAARMLFHRGIRLLQAGLPAKAISFLGQSLTRLYKDETRAELEFALQGCGVAYERLGLMWAARGAYLSAANIASFDFFTYRMTTTRFVRAVHSLKKTELVLGRIPQFLAWHEIDIFLQAGLRKQGEDMSEFERQDSEIEMLLARLLLRTEVGELILLERLPDELRRLGLSLPALVVEYLLGYEDDFAKDARRNSFEPEDAANLIWGMRADTWLPEVPNLNCLPRSTLRAIVLGTIVTVETSSSGLGLEIGEAILGCLQSFVATLGVDQAHAIVESAIVSISIGDVQEGFVEVRSISPSGRPRIDIAYRDFDDGVESSLYKQDLRDQIFKICVRIFGEIAQIRQVADLEKLFSEERVHERASAFSGSVGSVENLFGTDAAPKFRVQDWFDESNRRFAGRRATPWSPTADSKLDANVDDVDEATKGVGEPPDFSADSVAHHEMAVSSPIRIPLWDKAQWRITAYITDPTNRSIPILGLMFDDDEAGLEIFRGWRAEYESADDINQIRISIVRGISCSRPDDYRVLIGGSMNESLKTAKLATIITRINTMNPNSSENLERFLESYEIHKSFQILPVTFVNGVLTPHFDLALKIKKLHVRQAWQISRHDEDMVGIKREDDVFIPSEIQNAPVLELINYWNETASPE